MPSCACVVFSLGENYMAPAFMYNKSKLSVAHKIKKKKSITWLYGIIEALLSQLYRPQNNIV